MKTLPEPRLAQYHVSSGEKWEDMKWLVGREMYTLTAEAEQMSHGAHWTLEEPVRATLLLTVI